jgi:hypothetical protein
LHGGVDLSTSLSPSMIFEKQIIKGGNNTATTTTENL